MAYWVGKVTTVIHALKYPLESRLDGIKSQFFPNLYPCHLPLSLGKLASSAGLASFCFSVDELCPWCQYGPFFSASIARENGVWAVIHLPLYLRGWLATRSNGMTQCTIWKKYLWTEATDTKIQTRHYLKTLLNTISTHPEAEFCSIRLLEVSLLLQRMPLWRLAQGRGIQPYLACRRKYLLTYFCTSNQANHSLIANIEHMEL